MITISLSFIFVAVAVTAITEVLKFILKKYASKFSAYLPYALLVVLFVVYSIISKSALTGIINALVITAFATYFYDAFKTPVKVLLNKIKNKK